MILLIDNYDSFVYNLARYVKELGHSCRVIRNDAITVSEIAHTICPTHIIISPGPGIPAKAGISIPIVRELGKRIPILGVCLGHQAIGEAFGASIIRAKKPMHGMASTIYHDNQGIFKGISNPLKVARYHSLVVSTDHLPDVLHVNAFSEKSEMMALQHKKLPIFGVQFHPESILTDQGYELLGRFLQT